MPQRKKASELAADVALDPQVVAGVREDLVAWYCVRHRDLPWRRTGDPYAIWVSEIMLQQTQVETVKPYYHRFLADFPTVTALASAPLERVLERWSGLGYYSRARNLHRGAQQVVEHFSGVLPPDRDALLSIPGIGPYTAGAILSIAYGIAAPILDGNVARVLSRLCVLAEDPRGAVGQRRLWGWAEALVPEGQASAFNQGLMELGALVCTVTSPRCGECPLKRWCRAAQQGNPQDYPIPRQQKPRPLQTLVAVVVRRRGRYLVGRRPSSGLLGGLWEFPVVPAPPHPAPSRKREGVSTEAERLEALRAGAPLRVGLVLSPVEELAPVTHVFSHLEVRIHPWLCEAGEGEPAPASLGPSQGMLTGYEEWRWLDLGQLPALASGAIFQRVVGLLRPAQLGLFSPQ